MDILRCGTCHLIFRWPVDTPQENEVYYQHLYAQDAPQVMLPGAEELQTLRRNNFLGSHLDLNHKIRVLKALRPGGQVLDYGCSWAYGTYQLRQHGFDAVGFEISKPRAEYGRKQLGQTVVSTLDELNSMPAGSFDIIFSNHVIEHLPKIRETLALHTRLLTNDGFIFHVLPNFTGEKARAGLWLSWIGEDHPIAPTIDFFQYAIPRAGLQPPVFGSSPFDERLIAALMGQPGAGLSTDGEELLVVAQKAAY